MWEVLKFRKKEKEKKSLDLDFLRPSFKNQIPYILIVAPTPRLSLGFFDFQFSHLWKVYANTYVTDLWSLDQVNSECVAVKIVCTDFMFIISGIICLMEDVG